MNTPRKEYPRPQLVREEWINLNGIWEFQIDNEMCGEEKEYFNREHLEKEILVPFCPESELSQIKNTDFMSCVWYKTKKSFTNAQMEKQIILHFGAVDYRAILYVNGKKVGEHRGGYTSFSFDITNYVNKGENDITLCAYDDTRSRKQPAGKQSQALNSHGCFYTRTTGIWQTVWIEFVDKARILSVNYQSDIENQTVAVTIKVTPFAIGASLRTIIYWENQKVGQHQGKILGNTVTFHCKLSELHLWEVGKGNLYDINMEISFDEEIKDTVKSYFGMRTVGLGEKAFFLNGKKVFGRWVLDQGFYPDGIYTAPSDEALKQDILYSMQLGFNGARLHEKIFEPRFLYWADKLGYMVWEEHANWGLDVSEYQQIEYFLPEWVEAMERDMAHPSIIGWAPFNETFDAYHRRQNDKLIQTVYEVSKAIDPTRPVIDTSGHYHVVTDIFDVHDYEQDVEKFKSYYAETKNGVVCGEIYRKTPERQTYRGEPIFISEYGGIQWSEDADSWGYGEAPKSKESFLQRYEGLTNVLLDNPDIMGFCYTQLYDVEREQNGLMTYQRKFKFDPELIRKINTRKAAIEE